MPRPDQPRDEDEGHREEITRIPHEDDPPRRAMTERERDRRTEVAPRDAVRLVREHARLHEGEDERGRDAGERERAPRRAEPRREVGEQQREEDHPRDVGELARDPAGKRRLQDVVIHEEDDHGEDRGPAHHGTTATSRCVPAGSSSSPVSPSM